MSLRERELELALNAAQPGPGETDSAARREHRKRQQEALAGVDKPRLRARMALAEATADVFFEERFIGDVDLLPVNFLERGAAVARSVCRLELKDESGQMDDFATGVLVGENLLLTNHHVLPSKEEAKRARALFDFADDARGEPLPCHAFALDPDRFFCTDKALDYTFVAVSPTAHDQTPLERFGVSRLIFTKGKALIHEHLNIVQHPSAQMKQVAIRHNDVKSDQLPDFLEYETDTARGSSGSPVYNDAWVIVALHVCGVPRVDEQGRYFDKQSGKVIEGKPSSLENVEFRANRGVRISSIYAHLKQRADLSEGDCRRVLSIFYSLDDAIGGGALTPAAAASAEPAATSAVPATTTTTSAPAPGRGAVEGAVLVERLTVDRYADCKGFDESFLGARVPMPRLTPAMLADAAPVTGRQDCVLDYTHFSLVMSASRKLAFFTACNIDGSQSRRIQRAGADVWYIDGRIAPEHQTNDQLYARNRIDRGHLVRREDPVWGDQAAQANANTFHYTNCSPQLEAFNQRTWLELESYILDTLRDKRARANVFTGPVFGEQDLEYRGVKIPEQFWKVVVTREGQRLRAAAYIESQRELLSDLELAFGTFKTYRVPVTHVERLTGLDFGSLRDADTIAESGDGQTTEEKAGVAIRELHDASREVL